MPNVPDERLRAAAFAKELADTLYCGSGDDAWKHEIQTDKITAHDQLIWDSAMREAAGLVCELCADKFYGKPELIDGAWAHRMNHSLHHVPCRANKIHERLAEKERG